ncbi:MAG TPA: LysM peptidoglycan-binding domain-containing protein, partial [Candidatus Babeliaceae bacterium]|nr:LysM peptidoglycan-binding domain-containing protein [Candidatus Babeliaceae bacterium]
MKQSWYELLLKQFFMFLPCAFICCTSSFAIEGIQDYQKNMHLSEEHKQKLAADIYRYHNADNLWDELRHEFVLYHYEENTQVQEQIQWFLNHQDFLINSATRAAPYLYYILQQVRKRHLPVELVLLPMMESSYNPFAYSSVGAAGIWQMMPDTASGFGIKQNWWYDGRRDVIASTRAALDYLAYLSNFFDGNWLLAIGAYDTGEGNILSGIRKNIRDGKNTDFWSLPLAQETRIYVPRLLALAAIISQPDRYPINWPPVRNAPYLAQIDIGGQIDLNHAAELAGLSIKKLKSLNPGFNHTTTDPSGPFKLVLPIEHVERFAENLAHSPFNEHINSIRYKTKSGDTWVSIAKRFNMATTTLRKANPSLAYKLTPGKQLVIPHASPSLTNTIMETKHSYLSSEKPERFIKSKKVLSIKERKDIKPITYALENINEHYTLQPGDTLYMVRRGDDLYRIAKRFHTTEKTLRIVNRLSGTRVTAGERIIIPTHLAKSNETKKYEISSGDTVYMIRKGDSIEKIARKFHTTPSA